MSKIFMDLMNAMNKKQHEAASKLVVELNRKIEIDIEKRMRAIEEWQGIGEFPTKVPLRYLVKIGERSLVAEFPFQGEEELCKIPDIEIGVLSTALLKAGWVYDQDCNMGLQYIRE